ncbi:TonB periplasmic protein [Salinisphaera sp. C84B14]|uniref:DUF945 family protein n=1 Tax=Salinisphaera sp. C84B14 TaxID=1304155 RepID=UPI003340CAD6
MRVVARFFGLLIVLAGVGALVVPYFVGRHFEASFRDWLAGVSAQSQLPIRLLDYDRGWFDARARVAVGPGPGVLQFGMDIDHGPLPNLQWVTMDLELRRSPRFGVFDEMPATGSAAIGWFGDVDIEVVSPAAERSMSPAAGDIRHIAWGGLTARLHYVPDTSRFALSMDMPRVLVQKDTGRLDVRGLTIDWQGPAVAGPPRRAEDWQTSQTIGVDRFTFKPSDTRMTTFAGRLHTESSTPTANDVAFSVALEVEDLQAMRPQADPVNVPRLHATATWSGLDRGALEQMLATLQEAVHGPGDGGAARMPDRAYIKKIVDAYAPRVMAGQPTFVMEVPALVTHHGDFQGRIEASLRPAENTAATPLTATHIMQRLSATGRASMNDALMHRWLAQNVPSADAQTGLQSLADNGLVELDGERVRVRFAYDHETLSFNDNVAPPAMERAFRDGLIQGFTQAANNETGRTDSQAAAEGTPEPVDGDARFAAYKRRAHAVLSARQTYPPEALRDRLQGTARIQFTVERSGAITDALVIESSGHSVLDQAALSAVRDTGSLEPPGTGDGIVLTVPISFRLR